MPSQEQALKGIRVLDLSRVLAGPFCTQILGDLGADIIKVERPGRGDDTRKWGPPFLQDDEGRDTAESSYYLSANRNKRSIAIDMHSEEGRALLEQLIAQSDVLIENFRAGNLAKYGLSYEQIKERHPHLIYTSITGFGQTGPLATEPGYDFLAQAMAGLMAITGEPDGPPMKAGVALSDIITGLYAATGTLAALHHREKTGEGQHVDVALTDCTLAAMSNIAQYYLTSGKLSPRLGNAHATIVPYESFETADSHIILAIGNDDQFQRFCTLINKAGWADDPHYSTNSARVQNRDALVPQIAALMKSRSTADWLAALREIDVPCGPVNDMAQVFAEPQIQARSMEIEMKHSATAKPVKLVGSPLKLSETPVSYDRAPPVCGADTKDVLKELLDLPETHIDELARKNIIG